MDKDTTKPVVTQEKPTKEPKLPFRKWTEKQTGDQIGDYWETATKEAMSKFIFTKASLKTVARRMNFLMQQE